jgi:hypothetical protein
MSAQAAGGEDPVADAGDSDASLGGYAAQLDALRSVVKWLVAAFAGVGAILVAGLQVSGIGQLPTSSWRLYVAICAAGVALGGIGYMIHEASVVLTHEWLTLASFSDEPTGAVLGRNQRTGWWSTKLLETEEMLDLSRHELFGYVAQSRKELHRYLREADELIWRSKPGSPELDEAMAESAKLRKAARETVQYANFCLTLMLFKRMRVRLGWAAAVVAVSIGVFAYTTNPPKSPAPVSVRIVSMGPLAMPLSLS